MQKIFPHDALSHRLSFLILFTMWAANANPISGPDEDGTQK